MINVLYLMLFSAAVTDILCSRINNELLSFGLMAGMVLGYIEIGAQELTYRLLLSAVVFVLLYLTYLTDGLGAGDVKLISLCGIYIDKTVYFDFLLSAFVCGAVIGILKRYLKGDNTIKMAAPILISAVCMFERIRQ